MRRRVFAMATVLTWFALLGIPAAMVSGIADDGDAQDRTTRSDLFGLTRVVNLQIEVSDAEYQAMQPPLAAPEQFQAVLHRLRSPIVPASQPASETFLAWSSPGQPGP